MKPPCEMVVWYVIPAIRSELAKDLLKLGMKQKTISELMDITQPAVSQYLTDKRGSGIEFARESRQKISYVKFIGSMDMFLQTVKPV